MDEQSHTAPIELAATLTRRRTRMIFLSLGLLSAIPPASTDMYTPAFPAVARNLHASASSVQLTLSLSLLGLGLGQLLAGPMSDRFGRRRPLVIGTIAYTLASLGCALAPSITVLSLLRLLQGLSGAAGVVVARAVIQDLNPGTSSARYFSRLTLITGFAPVLAPSIGAGILKLTSWRGVFVVLGLLGVLLIIGATVVIPESLPADQRSGVGFGVIGTAFQRIIGDRVFLGYALCNCFASAGLFAYIAGFTFLVQDFYHDSAQLYAVLFGLNGLGMVAMAQVNARLVTSMSPRRPLVFGLFVSAAAGLTFPIIVKGIVAPLFIVEVILFMTMAPRGLIMSNSTSLAMSRSPSMRGSASAVLGAMQFTAGALASPLSGLGGKHSAFPMAFVMALFAVGSLLSVVILTRRRAGQAGDPPADPVPLLPVNRVDS